jgi:hypothetical protein
LRRETTLPALEAAAAVLLGVVMAFALAWLVLSGVLGATFTRARTMLRRAIERRRVPRASPDRRQAERRQP